MLSGWVCSWFGRRWLGGRCPSWKVGPVRSQRKDVLGLSNCLVQLCIADFSKTLNIQGTGFQPRFMRPVSAKHIPKTLSRCDEMQPSAIVQVVDVFPGYLHHQAGQKPSSARQAGQGWAGQQEEFALACWHAQNEHLPQKDTRKQDETRMDTWET